MPRLHPTPIQKFRREVDQEVVYGPMAVAFIDKAHEHLGIRSSVNQVPPLQHLQSIVHHPPDIWVDHHQVISFFSFH